MVLEIVVDATHPFFVSHARLEMITLLLQEQRTLRGAHRTDQGRHQEHAAKAR